MRLHRRILNTPGKTTEKSLYLHGMIYTLHQAPQ